MNNIKKIAILTIITLFLSCAGGSGTSSDADTVGSPGPVSEMDRSRYNLNEPDEMLHEMQDSVGMGRDTATESKMDTLID